ncbi:MAG: DUF4199 domain-containing protein [Chitinophagaceae bacterium]|nr:DUF4199 domain-containing protein [Chitinophagaceae bacterium]
MKKIILRSGLYSGLTLVGLFLITMWIGKSISYSVQEAIGYVGMILSLIFVYFGMRQYRDTVNGGTLTFGTGLRVGLLIVLIPTLLFGIFDVLYTSVINPGFYDEYCSAVLSKMKADLPAREYEIKAAEMKEQVAMFKNQPVFQFIVMSLTVFLIGLIITVISALMLRKAK